MRRIWLSTGLLVTLAWLPLCAGAQTTEPITFKGVPLGVEGSQALVQQLCKMPAGYSTSQGWCLFQGEPTKHKSYKVPHLAYGNVLADTTIHVTVNGSVWDVWVPLPTEMVPRMVELMTGKYGAPRQAMRHLKNYFGGPPVENPIFIWQDSRGVRITAWTFDPSATGGVGKVELQSPEAAAFSDAIPAILDKAERDSL